MGICSICQQALQKLNGTIIGNQKVRLSWRGRILKNLLDRVFVSLYSRVTIPERLQSRLHDTLVRLPMDIRLKIDLGKSVGSHKSLPQSLFDVLALEGFTSFICECFKYHLIVLAISQGYAGPDKLNWAE
ncbi:hypothetical protein Tco_0795298 [Tanacetum coccineum]